MPAPLKPPNQKQDLRRALEAFRKLALVAFAFVLISGGFIAIQHMGDSRGLGLGFLIEWGFWALFAVGLVAGYGLGHELARAMTHRQRWRHAAPWLFIIGLGAGLAWMLSTSFAAWAGRNEFPMSPVALLFGVVVGVISFRRFGRAGP